MLDVIRKRRENEEGFTLIELMVVVLIIAILLAIAIPTFLGARERAQNRAAQSDIRNALAAEKVFYTDAEVYANDASGVISEIEPSLEYVAASSASTDEVGLLVSADGNSVCIDRLSASGDEFSMIEVATGATAGTWYDDVACAGAPANLAGSPLSVTLPGGYEKGGW